MKFSKRALFGIAAAATFTASAAVADYPEKPIKIMVGFSAGGGTDTTARGFASYMHEAESMNGQPAYIVNLPGASGQKAAKAVLGEKSDGYTLYMINIGTFSVGELAKGKDRPYSVMDDFTNLGCASQLVTSLQVHTSNSAKSMQEYIDQVKASVKQSRGEPLGQQPCTPVSETSFLMHTASHKMVPFKGGSKARAALVSQSVEAVFGGVNTVVGFEDDIRPLASAGADRDPTAKELPTFKEQGLDGVEFTGLMCLFAKSDVPDEVKADVGKAIEQISGIKGFKKYMGKNDLAAFYTSSADATAAQAAMFKTMAPVVEKL